MKKAGAATRITALSRPVAVPSATPQNALPAMAPVWVDLVQAPPPPADAAAFFGQAPLPVIAPRPGRAAREQAAQRLANLGPLVFDGVDLAPQVARLLAMLRNPT